MLEGVAVCRPLYFTGRLERGRVNERCILKYDPLVSLFILYYYHHYYISSNFPFDLLGKILQCKISVDVLWMDQEEEMIYVHGTKHHRILFTEAVE